MRKERWKLTYQESSGFIHDTLHDLIALPFSFEGRQSSQSAFCLMEKIHSAKGMLWWRFPSGWEQKCYEGMQSIIEKATTLPTDFTFLFWCSKVLSLHWAVWYSYVFLNIFQKRNISANIGVLLKSVNIPSFHGQFHFACVRISIWKN